MQGLVGVGRSGRSTISNTPDQQQDHQKRLRRAGARSRQATNPLLAKRAHRLVHVSGSALTLSCVDQWSVLIHSDSELFIDQQRIVSMSKVNVAQYEHPGALPRAATVILGARGNAL